MTGLGALETALGELTAICAAAGLTELLLEEDGAFGFRSACRLAALLCLARAAARLLG